MTDYQFPVPHSRGMPGNDKCPVNDQQAEQFQVSDMILHILFARMTSNNGTVHEFETLYDPEMNAIEIDVPECYIDHIENVRVGPNIKRYLQWLVGAGMGAVAGNLQWLQMEDLIELNDTDYQTPDPFFEESLAVFLNGQKLEQSTDNGFIVLNNQTFRLKQNYPPERNMRVTVGYLIKSE